MSGKRGNGKGTFVLRILGTENATWQGSITWAEENKMEYFRSALEMLKLIDGVLNKNDEIEGGSHEE